MKLGVFPYVMVDILVQITCLCGHQFLKLRVQSFVFHVTNAHWQLALKHTEYCQFVPSYLPLKSMEEYAFVQCSPVPERALL